jgi:hypothetical protein
MRATRANILTSGIRPDNAMMLKSHEQKNKTQEQHQRSNTPSPRLHPPLSHDFLLPINLPIFGRKKEKAGYNTQGRGLAYWRVVSNYSSATVPDLHGIPRTEPLTKTRKEPSIL